MNQRMTTFDIIKYVDEKIKYYKKLYEFQKSVKDEKSFISSEGYKRVVNEINSLEFIKSAMEKLEDHCINDLYDLDDMLNYIDDNNI